MNTLPDRAERVQALTDTLLASRAHLPKAANGSTIAPSDEYVAQLLVDIGKGKAKPVAMLTAIIECNLRDGASLCDATAFLREMEAEAHVIAETCTRRGTYDRPIELLVLSETKAQFAADIAQQQVLTAPECPVTLTKAAHKARAHIESLTDFAKACERKAARKRVQPRTSRHVHVMARA